MPSNIVNLEEVVPGIEGKTFTLGDKSYHVPGDLPTDTIFEMLALFEDLVKFQEEASTQIAKNTSAASVQKVREKLRELTDMIDAKLLAIFQIDQPDLESLPFGSKSTNYILGEIFEMVGLASKEPLGALPAPPTPRPRATTPRKPPKK